MASNIRAIHVIPIPFRAASVSSFPSRGYRVTDSEEANQLGPSLALLSLNSGIPQEGYVINLG